MGLFSSIFGFIKDLFARVVAAISKVFSKIFGSPLVAALAMFVATWMVCGVPSFSEFMTNPLLFLTSSAILAAATVNVILTVISAVWPEFRAFLAKVMGFVSFALLCIGVWHFWEAGTLFGTGQWLGTMLGFSAETLSTFTEWFVFVSMLSTFNFVSGMAAGPDDVYAKAWVDGFMAVPVVVGDIADSAVDGVTSSLGSILLWTVAGFVAYKAFTKPDQTLEVKTEAARE